MTAGHLVGRRGVDARDDVALAVHERGQARVALGDDLEHEVLDLRGFSPVLVVSHEGDRSALRPVDELVGTRALGLGDGLAGGGGIDCRRGHDGGGQRHGQVLQERGGRGAQGDLHGGGIDGLDGFDAVARLLLAEHERRIGHVGVAVGLELTLDGLLHGFRVELGAVVELDAFAQLDGVHLAVVRDLGQIDCQARGDLRILGAVLVQAFVDVAADHCGLAVVEVRRVERARIGREAVRDGVGRAAARRVAAARSRRARVAAAAARHAHQAETCGRHAEQLDELASAERVLAFFHLSFSFPRTPRRTGPSSESCDFADAFAHASKKAYQHTLVQ